MQPLKLILRDFLESQKEDVTIKTYNKYSNQLVAKNDLLGKDR
jgi:hypothetical protein